MYSYYLFTLVLLQLHRWTDSQTIHVCTSGNGEQCKIDCETSDQTVNIIFTHPLYGTAGACIAGGSCRSGLGLGYTVARVNSTFTRLTIPSLNRTTDRGNWTCSYGSTASTPVLLPCPSPFGNGTQISVIGSNVTCQLSCQSPISGFTSLQMHYIQDGNTSFLYNVTSISGSTPSAADGCSNDEQNVILTRDVSSSNICGSAKFQCIFTNIYLGSANSSISSDVQLEACPTVAQYDYNWHILIGWIIGILIIPIAGFVFFMFQFVMKKHSGGSDKKCDGKFKKFGILVGAVLGGGALLALIICIIIATQVCLSQLGDAIGIGIGVSFGIMFMCVIIIVIVYFTCMKEKPDDDDSKPTTDKSEETNGKNNQIAPEKNKSKNKALDDVPKGRQLPSPRKDDEENKITMPRSLPPINHEENSTSSPKKKKKKRKSKENENEDKSE